MSESSRLEELLPNPFAVDYQHPNSGQGWNYEKGCVL